MKNARHSLEKRLLGGLLTFAACYGAPAFATCEFRNLAKYQIGQTTYVDVSNDIPVGTMVREGRGFGEGQVLLHCNEGPASFRGRLTGASPPDGLLPLTVGGQRSGFGIRLYLQEPGRGEERPIPYAFTRTFAQGEDVLSDEDVVRYEIYRMPDEVVFGEVDPGRIAFSDAQISSGSAVVFRSMEIYQLVFRRPTCSISAETLNQTVDVGTYHLGNFATPDRATPWVPFNLTVAECRDPVGMIARFIFGEGTDSDANMPDVFSLPANGPANVGLEIADADKRTIVPGRTRALNALGTGKDYTFHVRLRETRPSVGGGDFKRPVKVIVEFL